MWENINLCDEAINNKTITPFAQKNDEAAGYQIKQNKSESHVFPQLC